MWLGAGETKSWVEEREAGRGDEELLGGGGGWSDHGAGGATQQRDGKFSNLDLLPFLPHNQRSFCMLF